MTSNVDYDRVQRLVDITFERWKKDNALSEWYRKRAEMMVDMPDRRQRQVVAAFLRSEATRDTSSFVEAEDYNMYAFQDPQEVVERDTKRRKTLQSLGCRPTITYFDDSYRGAATDDVETDADDVDAETMDAESEDVDG